MDDVHSPLSTTQVPLAMEAGWHLIALTQCRSGNHDPLIQGDSIELRLGT
jgi:hypothetical protein